MSDKLFKYIFIVVIALIIIGYIFGEDKIREHYREVVIDTTYVSLLPDTVYRDSIITKWKIIVDSTFFDSLNMYKNWYLDLIDSLHKGYIPVAHDNVKFSTGDSLRVEYEFPPYNRFSYLFYPRPDKIVTTTETITNYIDTSPKFSLFIGGGIGFSTNRYSTEGAITEIKPEFQVAIKFRSWKVLPYYRYEFSAGSAVGLMYEIGVGRSIIEKEEK